MKKLPTKIIFFGFCLPTLKYAFKQKSNLFLVFFISFSLTFSHKTFAQGEGNVWYFGNNAGLDFNSGAPVVLTNGAMMTNEGCASISNSSGDLLFYTNGVTVWNNTHQPMPNGTGLLGSSSSTQSAIIVPKPGSSHIYYVFTTASMEQNIAGLRYSEVDMELDGGLGDITSIKNILLSTPCAERLTAVKKANGIDYWVIAHKLLTNTFLVYSVTNSGVDTIPVSSIAGSLENDINGGVGYLKATPDGHKLAQAVCLRGKVDVLYFNKYTGVISLDFTFIPPFVDNSVYGVEFSPDGTKLYVANAGTDLNIFQYNMSLVNTDSIIASATIIGSTPWPSYGFGALQIGPYGKMYVAKWSNGNLACINYPNESGLACGFVDNAINLQGNTSRGGLPNIIQSFIHTPAISYYSNCIGDTTYFSLSSVTAIDSVRWNFNDSASGILNSSPLLSPYHIFSDLGTYNVSAITHSGPLIDTLTISITILGLPNVSLGSDTTLCLGTTLNLDPGTGYSSYMWQNSSTNQTYTVANSGTYFVSVQNYCGTSSDTIQISLLPNPVVTVNSPTICAGQEATLTANGATIYSWNTGSTQNSFVISPTSTTNYSVIGTDINGCLDTVISTVTINPLPICNAGSDLSICSGTSIQMNASGGGTYSWSPSIGLSNSSISNPVSSAITSTTYTITVTDANNCTDTDEVILTVNPTPVANFSSSMFCFNDSTRFNDLSVNGGINWSWNLGDGNNSNEENPIHKYNSVGDFLVTLISTGLGGCNSSISIPLTIYPLPATPAATSNSPVCVGDTISLLASTADSLSYFWSGPNSFTGSRRNTDIFDATESMAGNYSVFVRDNNTGCISDTSTTSLLVNSSPSIPDVSATSQLCNGDTLQLASNAIAFGYLWKGPNSYSSTLQSPVILNVNDSMVGIFTLIVSNSNSCTSQDTISVFFDCDNINELFVPNVFTPNGDNANQLFRIEKADLKEVQVDIYDRWGLKVYSWNKLDDGWDGKTRSGLECPDGTYFYLINASTLRGKTLTQKGYLSLFR
jgi:gliding motility-associated-like protein